jgi:hypothetical protein
VNTLPMVLPDTGVHYRRIEKQRGLRLDKAVYGWGGFHDESAHLRYFRHSRSLFITAARFAFRHAAG